jgi:predicted ArsR family transcriptional regulator
MSKSDLTTSQVAERMSVTVHAVRFWIKRGLLPNAYEVEESRGSVWMIPEGDLKGFAPPKKTGRPPGKVSAANKAATAPANGSNAALTAAAKAKKKGKK